VVALLPGWRHPPGAIGVVPLASQRVASQADKELVGATQVAALLTEPARPCTRR